MERTRCIVFPIALLIGGMIVSAFCEDGFFQNNISWFLEAGAFHGSIVGRNKTDAVSGATKTKVNGAIAAEFKIKGHYIQIGVNHGKTDQHIDYNDAANGKTGERNLSLFLLDLPLLYNFHLLKKPCGGRDNPRLVLSLGGFFSFLLNWKVDDAGTTPPAKLSSWGFGPYLRIAGYPFAFGRFQPGLYLDFYRSFVPRFYDEAYFRQNSISGQIGILSCGLSLKY